MQRLRRWLFRLQPDRGEALLHRRRVYILPTRSGLLYATALLVMLLGSINYDLALGHALVFLLTGMGIVGMLHTFRNLEGLIAGWSLPPPVFVGETTAIPLHLRQHHERPRFALQATAGDSPVQTDLARGAGTVLPVPLVPTRRGRHPLPRLVLSSVFPLGLFRTWAYVLPDQDYLTYPRPRYLPLPPSRPAEQGAAERGERGQEDFSGFRARQPADPLRHIAWKAAARGNDSQPLPVKQFTGGAAEETQLHWDDLPPGCDLEDGVSILTGWLLQVEAQGGSYGLNLPGRHIPPDQGQAQRQRCLEALAVFGQTGSSP